MPVPPGLDLDEFKTVVDKTGSSNDALFKLLLNAAFDQAQAPPPLGTGRILTPSPPLETDPVVMKPVVGDGGKWVRIPDARVITQVRVDGAITTAYTPISRNGVIAKLHLAAGGTAIEVTGRFGIRLETDAAAGLRYAIYILAARVFRERDAGWADQVAMPDTGVIQNYFRQMPAGVKLAFQTFALASDQMGIG